MARVCTFLASGQALPARSPRLGISLGERAVALVELEPRRRGMSVTRTGVEPRRPDEHSARPALERLLERLSPRARRVVTALDAERLLEQRIELPAGLSPGEVERHLRARLGRLAATLDEPPVFDFCLADDIDFRSGVPQRLSWRLVACRPSELEARLGEFAGLGLEVAAMDVDLFALSRLVERTPADALLYRDGQRLWLVRDGLRLANDLAGADPRQALVDWLPSTWGDAPPVRLWLAGEGWASSDPVGLSEALGRRVAPYEPRAIGTWPGRRDDGDARLALAYALAVRGWR
ncbi:type IV pilus biogenesis protein PilM [Halotalea alkalilenta]|uniref:type IV pilus biogenesis protein PilM n=1 Tax=Halotalea alkalilenta TaxID=376489 RepID=UPI00138E2E8D|nr:pilus assembly protein PilM [Halotalea alkalilenta]